MKSIMQWLNDGWSVNALPGQRSIFRRPFRLPENTVEISTTRGGSTTWRWVKVSPKILNQIASIQKCKSDVK